MQLYVEKTAINFSQEQCQTSSDHKDVLLHKAYHTLYGFPLDKKFTRKLGLVALVSLKRVMQTRLIPFMGFDSSVQHLHKCLHTS